MREKRTSRLQRFLSIVLTLAMLFQFFPAFAGATVVQANAIAEHLIIQQVYGGGGKSDTPFTHSFIEIYNPTNTAVNLTGWKVDYSSSRGTQHNGSINGEWVSKELTGTIPAYSSYLIRGAVETTSVHVYEVNTFDLEWAERYVDNDQYNVRLMNGIEVVDQVTVKEQGKDSIEGEAIASISKQKSIRRINFQDTNNNASDFEVLEFRGANEEFIATNRPRSLVDSAWGLAPENNGPIFDENDTVIKLFHTNDIHSRVNHNAQSGQIGFAQFKTFIDRESENADGKLVLDAGDIFHGQSFASLERGQSIAELVSAVGYNAIVAGNHDFNYGWERLLELEEISKAAVLSVNTRRNNERLFKSYIIEEVDGVKVGIFGLTTPETAFKTNPNNVVGIDFGTEEQIIQLSNEVVAELQDQGAQLIIALSHLGTDPTSTIKSSDIAMHVPGIDVIIDGHSHTNYPNGTLVNNVLIASVGEHFKQIGVVTIGFNKATNEKTAITARSIPANELSLEQYPLDPEVHAVYQKIIERQAGIKDVVIGETPVVLDGARSNVRGGETNLGRLITNAMLHESGAQIAITNGGGIRESIPAGSITKGQVIDVLPFGNFIVTKSLTGAEIKAALEQGLMFGAGSFPHFAGMEVTVSKYNMMSGATLVERGRVESITVNGEPIDMTASYVVATNDFMAAGGDGYTVLQAPEVLNDFSALDEALIKYISGLSTELYEQIDTENRLVILSSEGKLSYLGSYSTGFQDKDGGVAEIVKYNPDNRKMYIINGKVQQIDIVSLADLKNGVNTFSLERRIDVSNMIPDFGFGDITSIDINTELRIVAAAIQEADYRKPGAVVLFDYDGNLIKHIPVGVQPDMVTFTPDGQYILTADEAEPRNGYGPGTINPKGSVSIISLKDGIEAAEAVVVTFDRFDDKREQLIADKVLLKKGAAPSVDLEPEYIAVSSNSKMAYVALQEANAIATLDIEKGEFISIKGLGFKDHSLPGNEIDLFRDGKIDIRNENVYGVYMPDGIATAEIHGKTYVITANEGDAREWGNYENIRSATIGGKSFDALKVEEHDGLEKGKTYVLGGRSFSIWDAETMELVFDSGGDFERITAERFPAYFNVSNSNVTMDHRSSKKGPEPEDVKVLEIEGKVYVAIGLERIGGVMMYEITEPKNAQFFDYINTRDFSAPISGDVAPEGLAFVTAKDSPTGYPLLLAAHEVSGTVAVYQVNQGHEEPRRILPFKLSVEKSTEAGMSSYRYSIRPNEGAATYTGDYYAVVQVYEGANYTTPGLVFIKKFNAGTVNSNEEIRIGQNKKVKIMIVSSIDTLDSKVLAAAFGVE